MNKLHKIVKELFDNGITTTIRCNGENDSVTCGKMKIMCEKLITLRCCGTAKCTGNCAVYVALGSHPTLFGNDAFIWCTLSFAPVRQLNSATGPRTV